jgi:hypothetical protein
MGAARHGAGVTFSSDLYAGNGIASSRSLLAFNVIASGAKQSSGVNAARWIASSRRASRAVLAMTAFLRHYERSGAIHW